MKIQNIFCLSKNVISRKFCAIGTKYVYYETNRSFEQSTWTKKLQTQVKLAYSATSPSAGTENNPQFTIVSVRVIMYKAYVCIHDTVDTFGQT